MIKNFGQFVNESKSNEINEAKMPMVSKELMKATEKMHAEQLKQQELQKKFVSETDATKKEKMKADLIAQHKKVKEAERNFQEALGREHVDYDDELLESNRLNEKKAYVELDTFDFDDADFQKFLKKNNIKAKQVAAGGPYDDTPVYVYTASDKDTLKKMLDEFWLTDAGFRKDKEDWYGLIESSLNKSNRLNEKSGDAVKTVNDAINSGDHINNVSYEEYLLPLAEYLDSYADRHMGDLEFSKKTFTAFYNLVQSMNADMKEAEDYQ